MRMRLNLEAMTLKQVLSSFPSFVEIVVPSTRVVGFKAKTLTHGAEAFVASSATTVGDVTIGERSSVWYGASVRGTQTTVHVVCFKQHLVRYKQIQLFSSQRRRRCWSCVDRPRLRYS